MKRSKLQTIMQIFALFCAILIAGPSIAEENSNADENLETPLLGPLNSDPLTVRGISPRVLDIALFPMAQGLYWEFLRNYHVETEGGASQTERFRLVFDPYTDYGRDLFMEFENEPMRSVKEYKRALEVTMGSHHWIRQEDRLYDPKSLRVTKSTDGHVIIAFRYDKTRVPTSLRWLTFLSGEVHIVDGALDRIELQADKTIERDGIRNYDFRSVVGFGAVDGHGGYLIDWMEEKFSFRFKRKMQSVHTWGRMLRYKHSNYGELTWVHAEDALFANKPTVDEDGMLIVDEDDMLAEVIVTGQTRQEITDEFDAAETVRLDLHRTLPFWADDVRKLGFELPKTYGVGVIGLWQDADINITDITVSGISLVEDIPLIDALGSGVNSTITSVQLRGDFWLLPFLNLSIIGGDLKTSSDVTLRFTPAFQKLYKLKTGEDLPEFVHFPASTSASTLGIGLTSGLQYENLIASVSVNYSKALTNETNSEISAFVVLGIVGYDFGDIGMQLLTGFQYQKTDQLLIGTIGDESNPIEFGVGFGLEETLFLIGINKDIGRNWALTGMAGMNGTRKQAMLNFGYRW